MFYIVNNNNRVVFRSKCLETLKTKLASMRKHSPSEASLCSITTIKPKVEKAYKYVSILSY